MKQILVTGATGFIGFEVARILAEEGLKPRLLVRRMLRGSLVSPLRADPVLGDLLSPKSLERAVQGVDTVFHLGARASFEATSQVHPSIVDGSEGLMQAAAAAGVESFVYASSMLVHSSSPSRTSLVDADTPPNPKTAYGRAKLEAETRLSQIAADQNIVLSVLRLPHVYGARDAIFSKIRMGTLLLPGLGANSYCHMHVLDAARALVEVGRRRLPIVSPVADDEPADWNAFFGLVKTYYPRLRMIRVPRLLALAGAYALHGWFRFQGKQTLETPDGVRGWNLQIPVRKGLVWDDLGLQPDYPSIQQGIPAVLDDCVSYRWIHPVLDHR
jgi:dihydroflavonol-4-reductase